MPKTIGRSDSTKRPSDRDAHRQANWAIWRAAITGDNPERIYAAADARRAMLGLPLPPNELALGGLALARLGSAKALMHEHPDLVADVDDLAMGVAGLLLWLHLTPAGTLPAAPSCWAGQTALRVIAPLAGIGEPVPPNRRDDPILPASLAMRQPDVRRPNRVALFQPPAHVLRGDSGWLPGFEHKAHVGPSLPLALYDLGAAPGDHTGRSPAANMALRVFVEGVMAVMERNFGLATDRPVSPEGVTLREFLTWFYGDRRPRPNEYWPVFMRAAEALDRHEARFPWHDPTTGKGGLRRVVTLTDIPRGPGALDDLVTLTVHLPPGSQSGPVINRPRLRYWGRKSEVAYRAMLGLAYRWFVPGVTRIPANRRKSHWLQSHEPDRYDPLSDDELIELCFPTSRHQNRRRLLQRAKAALRQMEAFGDLRIIGRRHLPPKPADRVTLDGTESDARWYGE